MNRLISTLLFLSLSLVSCQNHDKPDPFIDDALKYCTSQIERTIDQLQDEGYTMSPRNIEPGGTKWNLKKVSKGQWTSGFWPGVLWYGYEASHSETILDAARKYTEALEPISQPPAKDHDLGFLIFCGYGNGYKITGDNTYKDVINRAAESLSGLYNPKVGTILSWPRAAENYGGHNTIIDNMINLEMLFWSANNGGSKQLRDIAIMHADTTMKYHVRADGSTNHVTVYDPTNGGFKYACTHQGYSDESMWARGQGWAIYGYTMSYRFTKDRRYLDIAQKAADVYLANLPKDMIPYWDFCDPSIPNAPRDTSAAAIVASALIELSEYVDNPTSVRYLSSAEMMLKELDRNYRSTNSPALLTHATGHHPKGYEIDYSIIYADYYYIEALLRLKRSYYTNK